MYCTEQKFNCDWCKGEFGQGKDGERKLKRIQEAKGCFSEVNHIVHTYRRDKVVWKKCPATYTNFKIKGLIDVLFLRDKNYTIFKEPLIEMTAKTVETIQIIESLITEFHLKDTRKDGKQSKN